MSKDMTNGKPLKLILLFTIPMLIGNVFQQFYSMADTIVVGNFIGVKALAAVGATGGISFFVLGFIMGLANGFSVIVAQRFGANDEEGLRHTVGMSIVLGAAITLVVTIISVSGVRLLLEVMQTPADIINDSYKYISVIFAGTIATIAYNMISSFLRALGDSKTPLIFLIIASILNVILDIAFIVVFHMGVEGTAYATILAQAIAFGLCFVYTKKKYPILHLSKRHFKLDKEIISNLLKIGIPGALSSSITALGVMILQGTINQLGSDVVAAYTAGTKVEQFFTMPTMTLGMAMATFAGQNLGAGKIDRVKEGLLSSVKLVVAYSIIGGIILYFCGGLFTQLFVSADQMNVINTSKEYLSFVAAFCWVLGLLFVYRSTIQGLGNGFIPMLSGAMELIMRVIAAIVLSGMFGFAGICMASPIAWIGADVLLIPYYHHMVKRLSLQFKAKENLINEVA